MNKQRIWMGLLIVVLALFLSVGLIQAQEEEPPDEPPVYGEPAAVSASIPIQGRVTDAIGVPLNGDYDITFSIYDVDEGGVARCTDTDNLTVVNGLFNTHIEYCDVTDINGDALYLGVQVGADPEMTPRQSIYPVPYAWTVRPGATIKGANSYLFVPGTDFIKDDSTDSTRWLIAGASAVIYRGGTAGDKVIHIPITVPAVLYGQPMKVTNVRIYYQCDNGTNNYIQDTKLDKHTDADSWVLIVDSSTDRTSNSATYYEPTINTANNTLSEDQGLLNLHIALNFLNDTEWVRIAGVRLTLDATY